MIDIDSKGGDVVILVDEEMKNHKAHTQTILDESKQSGGKNFTRKGWRVGQPSKNVK